jgi:hypothetical protein
MVRNKVFIICASVSIMAVIVVYRSTDSEAVKACRADLESSLKSPSSLKIVETIYNKEEYFVQRARKEYILPRLLGEMRLTSNKTQMVPIHKVSFKYDADNSFGAALRDTHWCQFVAGEYGLVEVEDNIKKDPTIYQLSLEEQFNASTKALEASRKALEE